MLQYAQFAWMHSLFSMTNKIFEVGLDTLFF